MSLGQFPITNQQQNQGTYPDTGDSKGCALSNRGSEGKWES